MNTTATREQKASDAFLVLGSQYYVHARYSIQYFYMPVSATIFHHAVEMLLKGYLARTTSLEDLRAVGHDLIDLWGLFKERLPDTDLSRYDQAVSRLDRVERLRYPDAIVDEGYALHAGLGDPPPMPPLPGTERLPRYELNVAHIEAVALEVFKACGVSPVPYFGNAPEELKGALPREFRFSG